MTTSNPDEKPLDRPIVILGAPRSGTTILGDVLASHREFAYALEPTPVWRYRNEGRSDCLTPEHITPRIRRYIRSHFQQLLEKDHKTRLLEKTPQNSLRPEFVDAILPEARYLHVIRHGYESALSIRSHWSTNTSGFRGVRPWQRLREMSPSQIPRYGWQFLLRVIGRLTGLRLVLWGPRLPGMGSMAAAFSGLELAALQWRFCVERARHFGRGLGPERYLEVKLEELDSERFAEILRFCQMDDDPAVAAAWAEKYRPQKASHRLHGVDPAELALLRRCLEPTLEWLGYSADPDEKPAP